MIDFDHAVSSTGFARDIATSKSLRHRRQICSGNHGSTHLASCVSTTTLRSGDMRPDHGYSEEARNGGALRHESARLESESLLMRGLGRIGEHLHALRSPARWPRPSVRALAFVPAATTAGFFCLFGFVYGG